VLYTESHDEVAAESGQLRLPQQISPGGDGADRWARKRSTLAAAVMLTAPGIPMLFMGQEFLERGGWSDARGLDWSNLERFAGIHRYYRDLIRLRRDFSWTTSGLKGGGLGVLHVNEADKLIAYHRWDRGGPGDDVVVAVNFSARAFDGYAFGVPRSGLWRLRFNGDWGGYGEGFDDTPSIDSAATEEGRDGLPATLRIGIGPYTVLILSQDR
ncbi:MAG: alpha amylase C-terminal domain-containing protein, partial [Gluconacetobacter diazotrophicus]|nr:alpha amylase C-terminal domain-containing protein [Gluconacetobacter diazotrophicus]